MSTRMSFLYSPPVHIYYEGLSCSCEIEIGGSVFTLPESAYPHLRDYFWKSDFYRDSEMAECAAGWISDAA